MVTTQLTPAQESVRRNLADNLRRLRKELNWSQEDLALECDLHRTFVAHVERERRNISLDNITKLAEVLGVEAWQLLLPTGTQPK